jgi:hypothetical protein
LRLQGGDFSHASKAQTRNDRCRIVRSASGWRHCRRLRPLGTCRLERASDDDELVGVGAGSELHASGYKLFVGNQHPFDEIELVIGKQLLEQQDQAGILEEMHQHVFEGSHAWSARRHADAAELPEHVKLVRLVYYLSFLRSPP